MRRYQIRLGDRTTSGGTVKTATSFWSLNGINFALEGDLVDCPACNSEGVIKVVPPRLRETYNGRQYALGDDLCVCKCNLSPKLIPGHRAAEEFDKLLRKHPADVRRSIEQIYLGQAVK